MDDSLPIRLYPLLPVETAMAVHTTTLIIPILAVAYLVLVYGALLWWSRRSTAR